MKYIIALFSFCAIFFTLCLAQGREDMKKIIDTCRDKTGAGPGDFRGLNYQHLPESPKGWCMMACVAKAKGLMSSDNKLDLDKSTQHLSRLQEKHPDLYKKLVNALTECKKTTDANTPSDECEAAKNIGNCVHSKMA